MELMARGAEVLVLAADVADEDQMMTAMNRVVSEWGNIDGIFHTAGIAGEMAMQLIPDIKKADCERHFYAKVEGTRTIARTLERVHPKFCQLFSSNAALLGGLGSVAYSASSLFMDAFAENIASRSATRWISVDWDPWLVRDDDRIHATYDTSLQKHALTPEESWEALRRVAASAVPGRIVVSTGNLALRLKEWTRETSGMQSKAKENPNSSTLEVRPALATAYAPPGNELESIVINIWQETLRLDRLGIHDNFFDLGGNSLLGLRMITAVRKALQIELPIMALFEGPTVAALCRRIEQKESVMPSFQGSEVRGIRRRESAIRQSSAEQSIVACNALR
jgi:acyl carrier protein